MVNQRHCPYCNAAAAENCSHLALAIEGKHFVKKCVESANAEKQWNALCAQRRQHGRLGGEWSPEQEDFTWLETAFCNEFLRHLSWFGGLEHEWRSGPKVDQGGFWVLLWSKDPRKLWWELRDEFERQTLSFGVPFARRPTGDQFNFFYRR